MNTQMRGSVPEASGEAPGPEGDDSNMGTVPTSGPEATSSQGKHSRGPWTFITIANDYGKVICHEEGIHDTVCVLDYDNAASNGRLIAAAPELLIALQALTDRYAPGRTSNDLWLVQARAAIAKATQP